MKKEVLDKLKTLSAKANNAQVAYETASINLETALKWKDSEYKAEEVKTCQYKKAVAESLYNDAKKALAEYREKHKAELKKIALDNAKKDNAKIAERAKMCKLQEPTKPENKSNPLDVFTADYNNGNDYAESLDTLARTIAYAVVKRLHAVSGSNIMADFRRDIASAKTMLDKLKYTASVAESISYDTDGNAYNDITNGEEEENYSKIIHSETFGDGYDLTQIACVAILEVVTKQESRGETIDLERAYTKRKLDKRVIIRKGDSAKTIEVDTTPIQEVYRKVRKAIQDERRAPSSLESIYQYVPLDEYGTDMQREDAQEEYLLKRLPKYSVLGDYETDYNGKQTVVTANGTDAKTIDETIDSLNLTDAQKVV